MRSGKGRSGRGSAQGQVERWLAGSVDDGPVATQAEPSAPGVSQPVAADTRARLPSGSEPGSTNEVVTAGRPQEEASVDTDGRPPHQDASDRGVPLVAQQWLQATLNKPRSAQSHHGIVKRVEQHYAFVACQEIHNMYHRDVFVPARELAGKKLSVGDRVSFSVNILTVDNIQAVNLSKDEEATTRARINSDDAGGENQRFTGSIKSFNSESGYGFVTSLETTQLYGCDVFLHGSQIKDFGIGDRVMFTVRLNNKTMKPQAHDLRPAAPLNARSWLDSTGDAGDGSSVAGADQTTEQATQLTSGVSSAAPAAVIASNDLSEERYVGDIKSFNTQKGYGFIECAELFKQYQRDVFIHVNQFEGKKIGDHVTFKIQVKKGQPQAAEVSLADVNGQPLEAPAKTAAAQASSKAPQASPAAPSPSATAAAGSALGSVAAAVRRAEEAQREVEEAAAVLSSRLLRACASVRLEACDIIRDLLVAKAQPNVKDVTGQTPLMVAALNARQSERKCKLLIEYRADLESPLCAGMSAIEWAKQRLNPNFAAFLEAERIGKPLENYEVAMAAPRDDF